MAQQEKERERDLKSNRIFEQKEFPDTEPFDRDDVVFQLLFADYKLFVRLNHFIAMYIV